MSAYNRHNSLEDMDIIQRIRRFTSQYQSVGWILVLMGGGMLLQLVLLLIYAAVPKEGVEVIGFDSWIRFLTLPSQGKDFIFQPWSLVSYPFFIQPSSMGSGWLFRLLFGGIMIWQGGRIFQQLLNHTRTKRLAILAIPVVGLLVILINSIAPMQVPEGQTYLFHVSGALALGAMFMAAVATFQPNMYLQLLLFGRVKMLWIGIANVVIAMALEGFVSPGGMAVLASAGFGYMYIVMLKRGTDFTEQVWAFYTETESKPRMKVKYGDKPRPKSTSKISQTHRGDVPQDVVDKLLDKISAKGYDSLSREEKEILFKASKQNKDNGEKK